MTGQFSFFFLGNCSWIVWKCPRTGPRTVLKEETNLSRLSHAQHSTVLAAGSISFLGSWSDITWPIYSTLGKSNIYLGTWIKFTSNFNSTVFSSSLLVLADSFLGFLGQLERQREREPELRSKLSPKKRTSELFLNVVEACPNSQTTMVTPVQLFITFVLLVLSLADDNKLKHKPASKPVRLFTDEDLKRHDGSEVGTCYYVSLWVG